MGTPTKARPRLSTMMQSKLAALAVLALIGTGCQGTRTLSDPTVEIFGPDGRKELGVSTDYGLIFLGTSARAGEVLVTAWFGDGPSVENAVVEPLGGGLYTAETEIRLPKVPVHFNSPEGGERLVLIGRNGNSKWEEEVRVQSDARVEGLLVTIPNRMRGAANQVGAGLYRRVGEDDEALALVGLISGHLRLVDGTGGEREYLTAVGPEYIWRLVTYRHDYRTKPRWVYREDIL